MIATLNGVNNFSDGVISLKFKTISSDLDRCSGILFNVKQLALEYTLPEPVSGKIGLWSKTDSTSYFKDFVVQPA